MRPRKTILIAGECEERVSILAFALGLATYSVTTVSNVRDAMEVLREKHFEMLICDLPLDGAARLCDLAATNEARTPSLLMGTMADLNHTEVIADARMIRQSDRSQLMERIKVMTARKRGPKERKPVASVPASSALATRYAS